MKEIEPSKVEMNELRRDAEAGDILAQYKLAAVLATGILGEINPEDSFYWYMKAAIRGHAESIWNAGFQLVKGEHIEGDIKAGLHLIHLAANKHCYEALRFLGDAYHLGLHSLPKDKQKCAFWYQKADEVEKNNPHSFIVNC